MLTQPVFLAILATLGGAGGLFAFIRAVLDYRADAAARIEDADERFVARLERRLTDAEGRIVSLETQHELDVRYVQVRMVALASAGIEVPKRPDVTSQ